MTSTDMNNVRILLVRFEQVLGAVPSGMALAIDCPLTDSKGNLLGHVKKITGKGVVYVPAQSGYETYKPPTETKDEK